MKHTVIRTQPVQPPIEKIVLEVTPGELLGLLRALGWVDDSKYTRPVCGEYDGATPVAQWTVYDSLLAPAIEAGLVRK